MEFSVLHFCMIIIAKVKSPGPARWAEHRSNEVAMG